MTAAMTTKSRHELHPPHLPSSPPCHQPSTPSIPPPFAQALSTIQPSTPAESGKRPTYKETGQRTSTLSVPPPSPPPPLQFPQTLSKIFHTKTNDSSRVPYPHRTHYPNSPHKRPFQTLHRSPNFLNPHPPHLSPRGPTPPTHLPLHASNAANAAKTLLPRLPRKGHHKFNHQTVHRDH